MFVILDSDHTAQHVLAELEWVSSVLREGDYLVVEDGIINGHPVEPDWGAGPWEAVDQFMRIDFPLLYTHDVAREQKFGVTSAPNGYWVRTAHRQQHSTPPSPERTAIGVSVGGVGYGVASNLV